MKKELRKRVAQCIIKLFNIRVYRWTTSRSSCTLYYQKSFPLRYEILKLWILLTKRIRRSYGRPSRCIRCIAELSRLPSDACNILLFVRAWFSCFFLFCQFFFFFFFFFFFIWNSKSFSAVFNFYYCNGFVSGNFSFLIRYKTQSRRNKKRDESDVFFH